uniref:Uncharacterized protein n=1 Tax=Mesocestoides corti TaxID=53468 RepID=A0A5K3F319_MESCO
MFMQYLQMSANNCLILISKYQFDSSFPQSNCQLTNLTANMYELEKLILAGPQFKERWPSLASQFLSFWLENN